MLCIVWFFGTKGGGGKQVNTPTAVRSCYYHFASKLSLFVFNKANMFMHPGKYRMARQGHS